MQYITNGITSGQMLRYYNALEEAYENAEPSTMDLNGVKVEIDGESKGDGVDMNAEFTEKFYQNILGFKMELFQIEHKGIWKRFLDENGVEIKSVVLMPADFCEN